VAGAAAVGAAAAAAVFLRLLRRAVAAAVGAVAVGAASNGAAAVGVAVAGVVGNWWIKTAVEISFFDRRQRAVRTSLWVTAEEFAYLTKQMGPHGAAPSPEASMLIDEQLQVIVAIVARI